MHYLARLRENYGLLFYDLENIYIFGSRSVWIKSFSINREENLTLYTFINKSRHKLNNMVENAIDLTC